METTTMAPWAAASENIRAVANGGGAPGALRQDLAVLRGFGLHRHFAWRGVVEEAERRLQLKEATDAARNVRACVEGRGNITALRRDLGVLKSSELASRPEWAIYITPAERRARFHDVGIARLAELRARANDAFEPFLARGRAVVTLGTKTSAEYRLRRERRLRDRAKESRQLAKAGDAAKKQKK